MMQNCSRHRTKTMSGDLGPGVVTHASQCRIYRRVAHRFSRITAGKNELPSARHGLEIAQNGNRLCGERHEVLARRFGDEVTPFGFIEIKFRHSAFLSSPGRTKNSGASF